MKDSKNQPTNAPTPEQRERIREIMQAVNNSPATNTEPLSENQRKKREYAERQFQRRIIVMDQQYIEANEQAAKQQIIAEARAKQAEHLRAAAEKGRATR